MSITSQQDDRYFRTTSFYASCWLLAQGFELVNIDKLVDSKKAYFVFFNSPELAAALRNFNFAKDDSSDLLVNVRSFVTAIKHLKNALYQEEF